MVKMQLYPLSEALEAESGRRCLSSKVGRNTVRVVQACDWWSSKEAYLRASNLAESQCPQYNSTTRFSKEYQELEAVKWRRTKE